MPRTIYLHLLILCGIFSQGIVGTLADEAIKESSDLQIRQKRVVSYEQGGASIVRIEQQPYIACIKRINHVFCVGTILSNRVIITTSICAEFPAAEYTVVSKSAQVYRGTNHNVTNIKLHNSNIRDRSFDGIALFTIEPAIEFNIFVNNIQLHSGPLLPGMLGTVSGWGYNVGSQFVDPGTMYPRNLRTIQVPIISHRDCVNRYRNHYPITDKDICTFHAQRHSAYTDRGAPLVIDHLLVGIFLRSGPLGHRYNPEYPEVFALLQHTDYSDWIRANI